MKRLLLVALFLIAVPGVASAGYGSYYGYPRSYSYNYSYVYVNSSIGSIGSYRSSGYGSPSYAPRAYYAPQPTYQYNFYWRSGW